MGAAHFPYRKGLGTMLAFMEIVSVSASLTQGLDFEDLFDLAPVSLWMEDYSKFKPVLDQWRSEGVQDLMAFLREDPQRVQCFRHCFEVLRVNQFTLDLFKAPDQATLLARLDEVLRDDITQNLEKELQALWEGQLYFEKQAVNYDLQGNRLHVVVSIRILPGYEENWSRVLVSLKDITAEQESTRQLQQSEQYARDLFEQSPVSLWVEDFRGIKQLLDAARAQGIQDFRSFIEAEPDFITRCIASIRIIDVNRQTLRLFGADSKQALQDNLQRILGEEVRHTFAQQLLHLWDGQLVHQQEVVNFTLHGEARHLHLELAVMTSHTDNWGRVLISLVDITERKKTEAYLEYLSQHDVLTHLYNRGFYLEELAHIGQHGPWPLTLIAIDMNGLKEINDEQGHAAGDQRLRRMGEVLNNAIKAPACAARIGGDEFMVLLPGMDMHQAQQIRTRIEAQLAQNNAQYPEAPIHIAMGMACCQEGDSIEAGVHCADKAMYREKMLYYKSIAQERRLGRKRTEAA